MASLALAEFAAWVWAKADQHKNENSTFDNMFVPKFDTVAVPNCSYMGNTS